LFITWAFAVKPFSTMLIDRALAAITEERRRTLRAKRTTYSFENILGRTYFRYSLKCSYKIAPNSGGSSAPRKCYNLLIEQSWMFMASEVFLLT